MIKKIDHIGIAVNNLEESIKIYRDILGLEFKGTEEIKDQKIIVASFLAGDVKVELVQPTHPDSTMRKFIDKKGEGMHHIAFMVDNISESLKELSKKGINLIDEKARIGADNAKIAFIHPKDMNRVLIEFVERS
jgi:methylmalonyl-CoA/ethylmalonyl-CoA epimerase